MGQLTGTDFPPAPAAADRFEPISRPINEARHLDGAIYATQDYFEREKTLIFLKEWVMVCREEELARSGDYLAFRIMGEAVLVVRARDDSIKAFANVCRHRGVEVASGAGNTPMFVCPYHAWTYDLNGTLKGAPFLGQGRSAPENCNLKAFHVARWRGCVFICMAAEAPDFDVFIAPMEEAFGFLQFDQTRLARKVEFEMKCNWKLSLENLVDIYHVGTVHAKTFGGQYRKDKEGFRFNLLPNGSMSFFEDAAPLTQDGKSLTGQIPWLADRSPNFAGLGLLWPNFRLSARSDYLRIWNIWPIAPDRTRMMAYMLFAEDAFDQPDFDQKVDTYASFLRTAIEEDREMVESLQLGVSSANFEPGPLASLEEAIQHFLIHYGRRVGA